MRKTSIAFCVSIMLMVFSCGRKAENYAGQQLGNLLSVYGSPDFWDNDSLKFLPVEIFRNDDGWYAHYITRTGKHLSDTPLALRYDDNDTTVVYFDEISDGPAGYYSLCFMDYGRLMYTSSKGDMYNFTPFFYNKPDFDIDNVDQALQSIMKLHPADDHCTQDIADRIRLLIKLNPATLKHPMQLPEMDDFRLHVETSSDGKFRIYSANYYYGGCGHGNWPEHIMAQCDMGDGVVFIDNFSNEDYHCEYFEFPHVEIDLLGQMNDSDKALYFTETMVYDEVNNMPTHKILRAYAIENGGLVQKNVFKTATKTLSEIDVRFFDEERNSLDTTMFRYIPDTKTILVPLLKSDTLKEPVSQYIVYQWDGKCFSHKGTESATKFNKK